MQTVRSSETTPASYNWGRLMALAALAVILPLLVQCRGIGGYKSISFSKTKLATPPTTLSQRDYPFDEKGRYRTDWVKGGSTKKRSMSSFRSAPTKPTKPTKPAPTQTVAVQSPKTPSSKKSKKSSSSMTIAANNTPAPKSSPPKVYTPPPAPKPKPKPPASAKKQARYHTISKGDTLWGISRRYKVSITAIKSANGLSSDLIRPGQILRLP